MPERLLRVVIFSAINPRDVARIAARITNEVPEAKVCGVLYERRAGKPMPQRFRVWMRSLRDPAYVPYVVARMWQKFLEALGWSGDVLLRLIHACPRWPNGSAGFGLEDLRKFLETQQGTLLVTEEMHCVEALQFVRSLGADLGLVYGTRILKPELFNLPERGSINIHKRKVPDYRGGGPVGLWELLAGESEIGVTVHRVDAKLDAGAVIHSATICIDPYDTLSSLALKADVIGNDLIVRSVADFARGRVEEKPQSSGGQMFRNPKAQQLRAYKKQIESVRQPYRAPRGRRLWKLLTRAMALAPVVFVRNWSRRLRGRFPVVILYHHLVSDRPHRMAIPTDAFLKQIKFLKKHYKIASVREAVEMLRTGRVEMPTIVLTFDDGYLENFVNLRAVTEATRIPVTLFVCTEHISSGSEFQHDLKRNIRGFRPLSWEHVTFLSKNGFEVGSHTRSHFDCGSLDQQALSDEIVGSKVDLERHIGHPVEMFSFPWGLPENISQAAVDLARGRYQHIFSAYGGTNVPHRSGNFWHMNRCAHPLDLLELELQIQSILEFRSPQTIE